MPTIITRGAGSAQALGYAAKSTDANFIEDVFSTYLYTGNGSTQTITNGIDLAGEGGLVWVKNRTGADNHILTDSARGTAFFLRSNLANAEDTNSPSLISALNSNGFSLGVGYTDVNASANNYASWTFREQPKFFDIVTYTGTGSNRTIAHNLGSVPGAIWVKRTDAAANWQCYHRSLSNTQYMVLNSSDTVATNADRWNSTTPTSSVFSLGTNTTVNASGGTYVAYIFAHNAGGFGLSGTDNVISCGSYTGTGTTTGPFVNLGYEPQWIIVKRVGAQNWFMLDTMRYWTAGTGGGFSNGAVLQASGPDAEGGIATYAFPTSTGFQVYDTQINASGVDFIYIAIRRGPMKVPTDATKVFTPTKQTSTGYTQITGLNFAPDFVLQKAASSADNWDVVDKLRGPFVTLKTNTTDAESASDTQYFLGGWLNDGVKMGSDPSGQFNGWNPNSISFFRRAPGFFDEVCYTGTGSGSSRTLTHNLTVPPEIIITKARNDAASWQVYWNQQRANLNLPYEFSSDPFTLPTATQFTVLSYSDTAHNQVAYLFATLAGVSKVGSYTGTGTTQTINCGFTAGARFVLIKRTDSTGDWYVWDSARGIVAGNDPYLLLNSTAAEVTSTDYVDTASSGFEISSTAPAAINANGGSFIFLAIA